MTKITQLVTVAIIIITPLSECTVFVFRICLSSCDLEGLILLCLGLYNHKSLNICSRLSNGESYEMLHQKFVTGKNPK